MKILNKKYILMLATAGVLMSSCEDILDEKQPLDSRNEAVFYKTESDALEALVSVYDVLQYNTVIGYHDVPMWMDIASDDAYAGGASRNDAPNIIQVDQFSLSPNNNDMYGIWKKNYMGIYRANILLEKLPDMEVDEDFITAITAETKFLRAYFYFDQVRFFENIPLITTVLSPDEYAQPQAPVADVYAQIASDLADAIAGLPEVQDLKGRATKWSAEALLARVYLFYNGVYGQSLMANGAEVTATAARDMLDDIIDNSTHDLLPVYDSLFVKAGENKEESVFEINYSELLPWWDWGYIQGGEGSIAVQMQGPRVDDPSKEDYLRGWSFTTVTQELYDAYEDGDPRRDASILSMSEFKGKVTIGYQHTGFFTKKYTTKKEYAPTDGQTEHNWGNNYHAIRFADVLLMAAELHVATGGGRAQEHLDRVRNRVGLGSIPATLDNIFHERRVELALEGQRYWDVLRRGQDVAATELAISGALGAGYQGSDASAYTVTFNAATRGFFPIPQQEIDLLGDALTQNQGY